MDIKADPNEATDAQASEALTVDGCVCPQCFKPLKAPAVTDGGADRYGRCTRRSYAGMCFGCSQACQVLQFEQDGKWLIHKYLPHRYESGAFVGYGGWIIVNPLPEPPVVLTGPGGDYDEALDLSDYPVMQLLRSACDILSKSGKAFRELIEGIEKLRHHEGDNRKN